MSFLHPEFLYLMLPVLVILFSMLLTQQELKESIFTPEALRKLSVDVDQFSVRTRNTFYLFMFMFLILALATPVIERGHALTSLKDDTFYIALESSQKDFQSAQKTAKEVVTQLRGAQVGLLIYGAESYLVSPPTRDYGLLEQYIMTLEPRFVGKASSAVLLQSVDLLMDHLKTKQLVVISDSNLSKLHRLASLKAIKLFTPNSVRYTGKVSQEKPIYVYLFIIPIALAMIMLLIATSSFYRGEEHYVPSLLLLVLLSSDVTPLKAELLSYQTLESAQKAYDAREYERSAEIFKRYGMKMESEEAIYNAANSWYRAQRYKKALGLYRSIHFVAAEKNHALYHNIGNTLVVLATQKNLEEAILMYQKALHFRDESDTRENMQWAQKQLLRVRKGVEKHTLIGSRDVVKSFVKSDSKVDKASVSLDTARARYYKIELK